MPLGPPGHKGLELSPVINACPSRQSGEGKPLQVYVPHRGNGEGRAAFICPLSQLALAQNHPYAQWHVVGGIFCHPSVGSRVGLQTSLFKAEMPLKV